MIPLVVAISMYDLVMLSLIKCEFEFSQIIELY
jgi:hypothetical protein